MRDMQIHSSSNLGIIVLFLIGVLFFTSCGSASHHFYATDEGNLMALREKKDLKVSAGYTPHVNSLPGNNINFQLGYSPIKHLGIQSNFFRIRNSFDGIEGVKKNVYQHNYGGAIGTYFFKAGKTVEIKDEETGEVIYSPAKGKGLLFDAYVGYNQGSIENIFFGESGTITLDFQKYYLQGGIHIFLDRIGASFALKYAQLNYTNGRAFGRLTVAELNKATTIENNNPFNFLESALKISVGKPESPVRGYLTISGVYDFGTEFLEIQPSTMQFGVTADIDHFFKK